MQLVNWLETQPYQCILYPMRDCPGCINKCERMDELLGELEVLTNGNAGNSLDEKGTKE